MELKLILVSFYLNATQVSHGVGGAGYTCWELGLTTTTMFRNVSVNVIYECRMGYDEMAGSPCGAIGY